MGVALTLEVGSTVDDLGDPPIRDELPDKWTYFQRESGESLTPEYDGSAK